MHPLNEFISGANMMACFMAGLFFLRFWKSTRDRLFLLFAIAFVIMGANRVGMQLMNQTDEMRLSFYIVRLLAFLLILVAIIDKNRKRR